jgi:hypothetical protein
VNHFKIFALSQKRLFVHFNLLEKKGAGFNLSRPGQGQTNVRPTS